ncbi:MAG: azurin [Flavobacteriaceae bacterium]
MKKISLILIVLLTIVSSCGEKKTEEKKESFQMDRTKKAEAKEVNDNEIALSSNDLMAYDKTEIKVKAGRKITLTLRHTGKISKIAMGHNFVLLKQGTDIAAFAGKAAQARETDYIPESDAIIANTKLIGGGESTTITFDAPAPGIYDYICSFPGHYGVMQGKFIVE